MSKTYFLPLGGTGEIGMNLNLYGYQSNSVEEWIMVDCGVTFSQSGLPGIDLQMADPNYIAKKKKYLKGVILTHAHEDHIGAMPFIWPFLDCPIYTTKFTASLLEEKFIERKIPYKNKLNIIETEDNFQLGSFDIKPLGLSHSIPEMNALVIKTPDSSIFHSGDWKIDSDPVVGGIFDKEKKEQLNNLDIDLLVCDSTNAIVPGSSGSESQVRDSLSEIIKDLSGRIFLTTFASNVARLTLVAQVAALHDRQVVLSGRGMHRIVNAAKSSGYFQDIPNFVDEEEAGYLPADKSLILCTGSQGEFRAALSKIARDEHRYLYAEEGDTVIFSSKMIPGNEHGILRLQNLFAKRGVNIITEKDSFVHVSGHPCKNELLEMFRLISPKFMIPVHGEFRHMMANAELASSCNIESKVIENGDLVSLRKNRIEIDSQVENGRLHMDGNILVHDYESPALERNKLAYNGLIMVSLSFRSQNKLKGRPHIKTIGIPKHNEMGIKFEDILENNILRNLKNKGEVKNLESKLRNSITKEIKHLWGKKPFVEIFLHYNEN